MEINFSLNQETNVFKEMIKLLFEIALKEKRITNDVSVNVALVNAEEIQKLNKEYRNVDKVTDVLSFPMIDNFVDIENEVDFLFGEVNIGDIYINLERAKEQAKEYGHSLKREFCFLCLHGFLHLLGFDHMNEVEEKEMFDMQNKVCLLAGLERD